MNLPNKLTILRIIFIPIMIAVFYIPQIPFRFTISAVIFMLAAFTDFLDGYIARKYDLVTDLGKFLDPIADKILVLVAFIIMLTEPSILGVFGVTLGNILGGVGVSIIVAREMTVSVLRMIAATKNKVLAAEKVGKIKTFITDIAIIVLFVGVDVITLGCPYLSYIGFAVYAVAVLLTVYSGIVYLIKNKDVFN